MADDHLTSNHHSINSTAIITCITDDDSPISTAMLTWFHDLPGRVLCHELLELEWSQITRQFSANPSVSHKSPDVVANEILPVTREILSIQGWSQNPVTVKMMHRRKWHSRPYKCTAKTCVWLSEHCQPHQINTKLNTVQQIQALFTQPYTRH